MQRARLQPRHLDRDRHELVLPALPVDLLVVVVHGARRLCLVLGGGVGLVRFFPRAHAAVEGGSGSVGGGGSSGGAMLAMNCLTFGSSNGGGRSSFFIARAITSSAVTSRSSPFWLF